jgi:hypothetical protein
MTMRKVPDSPLKSEPVPLDADEAEAEDEVLGEVVLRPDGYHWLAANGKQEFGPFESRAEALASRDDADESAPEPGESLEEAEDELGIASWIDPDTGELAEGQSTPRFED